MEMLLLYAWEVWQLEYQPTIYHNYLDWTHWNLPVLFGDALVATVAGKFSYLAGRCKNERVDMIGILRQTANLGGERTRPARQQTTELTGAAGLVAAVAAVLVTVALAPRLDAAPVEPALKLVATTTCVGNKENRNRISRFNFAHRSFLWHYIDRTIILGIL